MKKKSLSYYNLSNLYQVFSWINVDFITFELIPIHLRYTKQRCLLFETLISQKRWKNKYFDSKYDSKISFDQF